MPNIFGTQLQKSLNTLNFNTSMGQSRNLGIRSDNIAKSTNRDYRPGAVATGFSKTVDNTLDPVNSILGPNLPINGVEVTFPDAAVTMQISSNSADDTFGGIGTNVVQISGLNSLFNEISEIVVLTGLTGSTTTLEFFRINMILVVAAGSNLYNVGTIFCSPSTDTLTAGEPDTFIHQLIGVGANLTHTAIYTVPAGHNFLSTEVQFSSNAVGDRQAFVLFYFRFNNLGLPPFVAAQASIAQGVIEFNTDAFTLPEKMDYWVTAVGSAAPDVELKHLLNGTLRKVI